MDYEGQSGPLITEEDRWDSFLPPTPLLSDENARYEMQSSLEAQVGRDLEGLVLVFCTVPQFLQDAPECTDLARTYGGAVEFPPDDFAVIVAQQGQDSPLCSGIYTPGGELRHAFDTN